jgi:23S rRNA (cytidine1920-2'-O)/16S rRNA (cytidine1409-2'-O)-methyltransferase
MADACLDLPVKRRLDKLLVDRGLAETREKAQALIIAGSVLVNNQPATKPGMGVADDAELRVKEALHPYVSRGGIKLEGAVRAFGIEVRGKVCLDVGSSTGGFTHFLLMNGAERVYALDVDSRQLDWKVRNDPKVRPIELNARFLEFGDIGEPVDLVTIDVSFISLTLVLPKIPAIMKQGADCIALVKPQFEVGRESVGKGGIVRDPALHQAAIDKVASAAQSTGLEFVAFQESPITGREGNREFFVFLKKP